MISLTKGTCPKILDDNAVVWRDELLAVIATGNEPSTTQKNRYNHKDIKDVLLTETAQKCAFCESKIRHIDDGDIEHFIPKSEHPEFSFEWSNLTLACTICNRNKSNYYAPAGDHNSLINPYADEPRDHFLFHKEIITPAPESLRAIKTEEILDLNRGELVERRREQIAKLHEFITAYAQANDPYKPMVARQIRKQCSGSDKEYSAFLTKYISEMIERGVIPDAVLN